MTPYFGPSRRTEDQKRPKNQGIVVRPHIRLIKTPALADTTATRAGGFLIERRELLDPIEDGGWINVDATFG